MTLCCQVDLFVKEKQEEQTKKWGEEKEFATSTWGKEKAVICCVTNPPAKLMAGATIITFLFIHFCYGYTTNWEISAK